MSVGYQTSSIVNRLLSRGHLAVMMGCVKVKKER